jgi:hypothetical protein
VFVNRRRETAYYFLDVDAEGRRLEGGREYRLTFPRGSLPPARGFWSLTVYDERHGLPDEAGGRHSLGSRTQGLEYGPDGSLTITISPAASRLGTSSPAAAPNRLTTPARSFSLYLRLYWPEPSVVEGAWSPPALLAHSQTETPAETDLAGAGRRSAPSQEPVVSLTYVDFAGWSAAFRPKVDPSSVSLSLTGHLGGASLRPSASAGEQGGPDVRVP